MLDEINKLREHLKNLYPIFDQFCENFCFEYATPSSIGRYPRIRVEQKTSNIKLWLDLWMEFDEQGRRFQVFNPYLSYELSA